MNIVVAVLSLFSWLPDSLRLLCGGAVAIFLLVGIFRLVSAILGLLPFFRR